MRREGGEGREGEEKGKGEGREGGEGTDRVGPLSESWPPHYYLPALLLVYL